MRHKWPRYYLAIALCCAATTIFLRSFPAVRASLDESLTLEMPLFVLATPLMWIVAVVKPAPVALAAIKVHAAVCAVLLVIDGLWDLPNLDGQSGVAAVFGALILILASVVSGLVVLMTRRRAEKLYPNRKSLPFLYLGVTAALLVGWFTGYLIWSPMLPAKVIAAAESAADDRPYCIYLKKGAVRSASDLTGLSMRYTFSERSRWRYVALLVIGELADRRYMYWSFKTHRFESISDDPELQANKTGFCQPKIHFARDWL